MTRDGRPNLSREIRLSGANRDRKILIFSVQLTTSRIGNLKRLIHALLHISDEHMRHKEVVYIAVVLKYPDLSGVRANGFMPPLVVCSDIHIYIHTYILTKTSDQTRQRGHTLSTCTNLT